MSGFSPTLFQRLALEQGHTKELLEKISSQGVFMNTVQEMLFEEADANAALSLMTEAHTLLVELANSYGRTISLLKKVNEDL